MAYRKMTQDKMTNGDIPPGVYKASEDIEVFRIGKRKKDKGKGHHPCILRCVVPKGALIVKPISDYNDPFKMRTDKLITKSITKVDVTWSKVGTLKFKVSPNVRYSKCISPLQKSIYSTFTKDEQTVPLQPLCLDLEQDCGSGIYFYGSKKKCTTQLDDMLFCRPDLFRSNN